MQIEQTLYLALNTEGTAVACYADDEDQTEIEFVPFDQLQGRQVLTDTWEQALRGDLENLGIDDCVVVSGRALFGFGTMGQAPLTFEIASAASGAAQA